MIDDLIHDIRSALTEAQLVDLDQRLAKASDRQARIGALLQSAWQCKGAATLAGRVYEAMSDGITKRPREKDKNYG